MEFKARQFMRHGKVITALLLASLVLLLDAMASCPSLHELIHKDADTDQHHCAVTMFAHGKVDLATVDVSPVASPVPIEATPQFTSSVFAPAIENLPAGRAPPVSV